MFYLLLSGILALAAGASGYVATKDQSHENRELAKYTGAGSVAAFLLLTGAFSVGTVSTGSVAVRSTFGSVNLAKNSVAPAGLTLKSPLEDLTEMSVQQQQIVRNHNPNKATDGGPAAFYTADNVKLTGDLAVPFALNPEYAPRVLQALGQGYRTLVANATSSALRNAAGGFTFEQAMTTERHKLEESISETITTSITEQLSGLPAFKGLSKQELSRVFIVSKVQLGDTAPPPEVQAAISSRQAADQELAKQESVLKTAKKKAEILAQNGSAVRYLLAGVAGKDPAKFNEPIDPMLAVQILNAMANMTDANARAAAADKGNVPFVLPGGSSVTVPVNPSNK